MNKQALAFLTMFSLILMLSVYYVTLPADTTAVVSTESGDDLGNDQSDTSNEKEQDIENLKEEINKKNDEEVKKNSDVVSNKESSDAQKQAALATIDTLKNDKAVQDDLGKALGDQGYASVVEVKEGTCRISVFDQSEDKEVAKKIMTTANEKTAGKYLVEVAFK